MNTNPYAPPKAAVADRPLAPGGLKRRSVWLMIVFTIVTFGIYYIIWFYRRRTALNALNSPRKLKLWPILAFTALIITNYAIAFIVPDDLILGAYGSGVLLALGLARLAIGIVMLVQCFIIKSIIEDHVDTPVDPATPGLFAEHVQLSGLMTFFFSIFYLQYAINKYIADPQ